MSETQLVTDADEDGPTVAGRGHNGQDGAGSASHRRGRDNSHGDSSTAAVSVMGGSVNFTRHGRGVNDGHGVVAAAAVALRGRMAPERRATRHMKRRIDEFQNVQARLAPFKLVHDASLVLTSCHWDSLSCRVRIVGRANLMMRPSSASMRSRPRCGCLTIVPCLALPCMTGGRPWRRRSPWPHAGKEYQGDRDRSL